MMPTDHAGGRPIAIPARDGFALGASIYEPRGPAAVDRVVTINAATAVRRRFYDPLARFLAGGGATVVTYDYRGVGDSRPASLRGFHARARDWTLLDMAGVVDWIDERYRAAPLIHIGHSYGGQTAGLLPNGRRIGAMVTLSAQSGYWKLQGGRQRLPVAFHTHVTLPLLAHAFGYVPWSWFSKAEDLPKGVGLEWCRWCRDPDYLLGDRTLPLERYAEFVAPVLAYSFEDDDWGTARSVDAMMRVYPNLERRHVDAADVGLRALGHFGFFRPGAEPLWREALEWIDRRLGAAGSTPGKR